MFFALQEVIHI